MSRPATSSWLKEASAILSKEWRVELRARHGLATVGLFAVTSLVLTSLTLGPLGTDPAARAILPSILWILLLFTATAAIPRAFVHEEEVGTARALRLSALPSCVLFGKMAFVTTLLLVLEAVLTPLFATLLQWPVADPLRLACALAAGGVGLAAASTLVAAMVANARGRGALFPVLAFPVLLPLLILAVGATRSAAAGIPDDGALRLLLLYDGSVVTAAAMLFPAVWES